MTRNDVSLDETPLGQSANQVNCVLVVSHYCISGPNAETRLGHFSGEGELPHSCLTVKSGRNSGSAGETPLGQFADQANCPLVALMNAGFIVVCKPHDCGIYRRRRISQSWLVLKLPRNARSAGETPLGQFADPGNCPLAGLHYVYFIILKLRHDWSILLCCHGHIN